MILTPIDPETLPAAIATMASHLDGQPVAQAALLRIVASTPASLDGPYDTPAHRAEAVALVRRLGIAVRDDAPARAFSYDGYAIRVRSEAYVLIHEVAHYQVCAPERRPLPDFGLGAGPESGRAAEADAAQRLFGPVRESEEQMASLLGILWEAELGQPALFAFLEQNWMEGWARPAAAQHFATILGWLQQLGLVDSAGHPLPQVRTLSDALWAQHHAHPSAA
jgi:hypothetical protein